MGPYLKLKVFAQRFRILIFSYCIGFIAGLQSFLELIVSEAVSFFLVYEHPDINNTRDSEKFLARELEDAGLVYYK